jgi:DNA polymerase
MNEDGRRALRRFIRSRWEDRDATLFLTDKKTASASRPIQSGPVVPPARFRPPAPLPPGQGSGEAFTGFRSAVPVAPRQWSAPAPAANAPLVATPRPAFGAAKPSAGSAPSGTRPAVNRHKSGIIEPEATAKGREMLKHWEEIRNCQLCPLGKTRNCFVYGMGRADTKLVFIGEAPGQQEDMQGLPFVGASGKMLDGILAGLNLSRDSYFICNVLKCRPPENRNPQPDEIEKCAPYLEKQMKILAPKYVVALGTFAAQSVLKTIKPIGQLRGRWHQLPDYEVLPVYHPSAACRSTANKKVLEEDLLFLKKRLEADKSKSPA